MECLPNTAYRSHLRLCSIWCKHTCLSFEATRHAKFTRLLVQTVVPLVCLTRQKVEWFNAPCHVHTRLQHHTHIVFKSTIVDTWPLRYLGQYEVIGTPLALISSYLKHRTQIVHVGSSQSIAKLVNGCILGPLLFLLFVNDLYSQLVNVTVIPYADDTNLLISDRNKSLLIN